jgi:hypothetical protein
MQTGIAEFPMFIFASACFFPVFSETLKTGLPLHDPKAVP